MNTCGASDIKATLSVSVGEITYNPASYTLTSLAKDVEFSGSSSGEIRLVYTNNSKKAIYIKSIEVTYEETSTGKTSTTLSFGATSSTTLEVGNTFTLPVPTLKAGDETLTGKTFSYTSSAPTVATVNETTGEVTALAEGTTTITAKYAGDDTYAASSADYTVNVKKVYTSLADLKKAITATEATFNLRLTDAVVSYVNGSNVYLEDATGGILVYYYNAANDFKAGQKLNGDVQVKAKTYYSLNEITSWKPASSLSVVEGAEIPLTTLTLAGLVANYDRYESCRVKVENVTVTSGTTGQGQSGTISQNETDITLRTNAYILTTKNDVIDVTGFPGVYNTGKQLNVWSQSDIVVKKGLAATTLSFDTETTEFTVEKGQESSFTAPKATVKDADGKVVEGAVVTYESDNSAVAAVDGNGNVTFGSELGTAVITANYAGDDTHKAAAPISYTIVYGKVPTVMAYAAETATAHVGDKNFTAPTLTLTANGEDILAGKTITYTSDNENVAMVDEDGTVELMDEEGTAKITATFAGDDTYTEASASFTLTVTDPNKKEVTFDFTKPEDYGYQASTSSDADKGNVAEGSTIVSGNITITNIKNGSTSTRFWNHQDLRVYEDGIFTVSAPAGVTIKKIEIAAPKGASNLTTDVETYTSTGGTYGIWEGAASSVKFTASDAVRMTSVTVTYGEKTYDYTFDDTKDCTPPLVENKSVKITRKRAKDQLNTICLPFDLSAEQIATTFGEGTEVYEFDGVLESVLYFKTVTSTNATMPYLIKPAEDKSELTFDKIELIADYPASTSIEDEGFQLIGTYSPATLATDGTNLFLAAGAQLKKPSTNGNTIKGFRAYFKVPAGTSDAKLSFGGIDTSIDSVTIDGMSLKADGQVYNLNGQRVGSSLNGLAKGIYLMNGKKYVVR